MSKNAKNLAPKLRFPEFRNSQTWKIKKLNELLFEPKLRNRNLAYSRNEVLSVSGEHGCVNQIELLGRSYAGVSVKDYHVVASGDIVYTKSPLKKNPYGIIKENKGKAGIVSTLYAVYRVTDNAISAYIDHYFSRYYNLNSYLQPIVKKGAKNDMKVNNSDVLTGYIPAPDKDEQKKISDCLSSINDLISAQSQKVEALKTHKKGLMQQLFPREGETVPRLRFTEFRDSGEWVPQRIEELAKRGSGHTPDKKQANYYNGGIKWVSLADSNMLDNGYLYSTKNEISKDGLKNSSAVLHPAGTVILSRDAGVGKSAVLYSDMAVSQHFMAWVCDGSKLSNWFLYYVLQILKPTFESIAVGSTIKTIGLPYFKSLFITIPSVKEQNKIANCLFGLDSLITAQTQKLEALRTHKKGLMQQLFPSTEANELT